MAGGARVLLEVQAVGHASYYSGEGGLEVQRARPPISV
jgi:hypothetical protein